MIIENQFPRAFARIAGLCAAFFMAAQVGQAQTQAYPARPVRIISVTGAGTGTDDFTRLMAKHMSQKLGQNFYIENKPGANTFLACEAAAKSAPDGYTLLLAVSSSVSANPYLFKSMPYDPNKDFVPVARLGMQPVAVVVPAGSPYRTLSELLAAGRAKPGKLNYGSSTSGYRIMLRAINGLAKVEAVDVPYKATGSLVLDMIGGAIDYSVIEVAAALPLVQSNKLRILALSSPQRVPALPDVPTLNEAGMGEAALVGWTALMAPAGTPKAVVDKLAQSALEFLKTPEATKHFQQRSVLAFPATGPAFSKFIVEDQARWKRFIEMAGIQPE